MKKDDTEIVVALIDGNEQFLQVLVETGMSWWVSSVAFCAAVVVAVWMNRDSVAEIYSTHRLAYHGFMSLVLGFFVSIVGYGLWMIRSVFGIRDQLTVLIQDADINIPYPYFEFTSIWVSFLIGTSSFIILCVIWAILWASISKYLNDRHSGSISPLNEA